MSTFLIWWLLTLVLGIGFMPLTSMLFSKYKDRGWMFSKVLGLAISGFVTWVIVCRGILPFTEVTCMLVSFGCIALNLVLFYYQNKNKSNSLTFDREFLITILTEEILFFVLFLVWTYIAGFRPAAYGTEKFMDFGFMAAMMRSVTLPAEDLWYSGEVINYYYGGQYYAVFMTKLTQTRVAETYNVMRTMIAAYAFVLPFVIVRQLWSDVTTKATKLVRKLGVVAAVLAGMAVSLAGNMHYVIIGVVWPFLQRVGLMAVSETSYWFPNSTRYLGHYPAAGDETIHEFPSYSFVLGDLHAHVINIIYVLTVIAILYSWIQLTRQNDESEAKINQKSEIFSPYILILGFFIGIFQWTNYWDFLIYFVVTGAVIVYRMILLYGLNTKLICKGTALQAITISLIGFLVALPFTLLFKTMKPTSGGSLIGLVENRSIYWQWLIIWGLPLAVSLLFLTFVVKGYQKGRQKRIEKLGGEIKYNIFEHVNKADAFVAILTMCALGLIFIPEIVYVRDIYEATAARANTMFKLTYQAFMMFGMCMVYTLMRFIVSKRRILKVFGISGIICLLTTFTYIGSAVFGWFGDVSDISRFQGLDATQFLEKEETFLRDAPAIRWLQANIKGSPVVLEADGDSYSDYCRVSAMTGLPTIAGWYVHEWLWRSDTNLLNGRVADIASIYTTENWDVLEGLVKEYNVSYIFVGKREREKFEDLNHAMLRALGEVVFEENDTYIVKLNEF